MSDAAPVIGYCTNVHAGATLEAIRENLVAYAVRVRERVAPMGTLHVGLWIPEAAARALVAPSALAAFRDWLEARGLAAFTLNGFPQRDFHSPTVKHEVYRPNWTTPERVAYTLNLVDILAGLSPSNEASISTLPLGWRADLQHEGALAAAAEGVCAAARHAAEVEVRTGVRVHIDLEPEPGCMLDRAADVVAFFEGFVFTEPDAATLARHLGVCHDVCHAAVMFEAQDEVVATYRRAGIDVGKVQVSSALHAPFDTVAPHERAELRDALGAFAEERYLHQTSVRSATGAVRLHDDLPIALGQEPADGAEAWRVHFHVPIHVEAFDGLLTTRPEINACLAALRDHGPLPPLEIETYAWNVLPEAQREADLAAGIAREMTWMHEQLEPDS